MAKRACLCGNQIRSSGAIPNPQEWHLISDVSASELIDESQGNGAAEQVLNQSLFVYGCERCDRLHVYWSGLGDWPPTICAHESG